MSTVVVRKLGLRTYPPVFEAMHAFTAGRGRHTRDEFWLVEHPPIFTLGRSGKREHILDAGDIPVLQVDRGGQVTYHGPGQAVIYLLMDLRRRNLGVRQLVHGIERAMIDCLAGYGVNASGREGAPGVYVEDRKIAALGLRIRRSCSYHGLSLNVDMDLSPFTRINPCGYEGLETTQLKDLGVDVGLQSVSEDLCARLASQFNYAELTFE
ncbi:MAG: lipoyl(octanoyl) transferase LipB [Gammaproteobacteria bacterium]